MIDSEQQLERVLRQCLTARCGGTVECTLIRWLYQRYRLNVTSYDDRIVLTLKDGRLYTRAVLCLRYHEQCLYTWDHDDTRLRLDYADPELLPRLQQLLGQIKGL